MMRRVLCQSIPILLQTAAVILAALSTTSLHAFDLKLDPPREREFTRDLAKMLDASTETRIHDLANQLLSQKQIPLIVITIDSMEHCGGGDLRIDTFAAMLFDHWGIREPTPDNFYWDNLILLLVSKNDRKVRIQLGSGWGHSRDDACRSIVREHTQQHFSEGLVAQGIETAVQRLCEMARDLPLPETRPWWYRLVMRGLLLVAFAVAASALGVKKTGKWVNVCRFLFVVVMIHYLSNGGLDGAFHTSGNGRGATASW